MAVYFPDGADSAAASTPQTTAASSSASWSSWSGGCNARASAGGAPTLQALSRTEFLTRTAVALDWLRHDEENLNWLNRGDPNWAWREPDAPAPAPYPHQRALVARWRSGDAPLLDRVNHWAGQSAAAARPEPAGAQA